MNWYQKVLSSLLAQEIPFLNDGKNIAIFKYISPRHKPHLTVKEKIIRDISYRIKVSEDQEAMQIAAGVMARHIPSGSILVPVPSSSGSTKSNLTLANMIASLSGSKVLDILTRSEPVIPLHMRRKERGLERDPTPEEHKIIPNNNKNLKNIGKNKTIFLIDNVITSGSTMEASRISLGIPNAIGLAFSKA